MRKTLYARLKQAFAAATLALLWQGATAQDISTYTFRADDTTYVNQTGLTVVGSSSNDDDEIYNIDLGFSTTWAGETVSQFGLSPNGYLVLGDDSLFQAIYDAQITVDKVVAGLNRDLKGNGSTTELGYTTGGTAPNRWMVAQWSNFRRYTTGTQPNDVLTWQIWVHESGKVEIIYGDVTFDAASSLGATFDVGVNSKQDTAVFITQSFASPIAVYSTDGSPLPMTLSASNVPAAGRRFTFTPPAGLDVDLSVGGVTLETGRFITCINSATAHGSVKVRNLGAQVVTGFDVRYRFDGGAPQTYTVSGVSIGQYGNYTVQLPGTFDISSAAAHTLTAVVVYPGDLDHSNDSGSRAVPSRNSAPGLPDGTVVNTFEQATAAGYRLLAGSRGERDSTGGFFTNTFTFSDDVVSSSVSDFASPGFHRVWLARMGYRVTTADSLILAFNLANNVTGSIDNDTFKIAVSTDCGATWRTVRNFTRRDITTGNVNSTLKPFIANLGAYAIGTSLSYAFYVSNGGTLPINQYYWGFNNIHFLLPVDAAATSVYKPGLRDNGCAGQPNQEVDVRIVNLGSRPLAAASVTVRFGSQTQTVAYNPATPLASGASDIVVFSGAQSFDFSASGNNRLHARVSVVGDSIASNDTAVGTTYTRTLHPITVGTRLTTISQFNTAGWRTASGNNRPQIEGTRAWADVGFGAGPVQLTMSADTLAGQYSWLIGSGLQTPHPIAMRFKARVLASLSGSNRPSSLEDDTIKVVISTDCGASYQSLLTFTDADLTSRRIDENFKKFGVQLPGAGTTFQLAFYGTNNGTPPGDDYRFQIDSVEFINGYDVAIQQILQPSTLIQGVCAPVSFPVSVRIANKGVNPVTSVKLTYKLGADSVSQTFTVNLAGEQTANLSFSTPATLRGYGLNNLIVYASDTADKNPDNDRDTANVAVLAPSARPTATYFSLLSALNAGYINGAPGYTPWSASVIFGASTPTIVADTFAAGSGVQRRILSSARYYSTSAFPSMLRFRIAATAGKASTTAVTDIDDDSLLIYVRTGCDAWTLARAFTQADIASGGITNRLRVNDVGLPIAASDTFQVAFVSSNAGTLGAPFAWHITGIQFVDNTAVHAPEALGLSIYPNPTQDKLHLSLAQAPANAKAELIDVQGRVVLSQTIRAKESALPVAGLPSGLYVVRYTDGANIATARITVQ